MCLSTVGGGGEGGVRIGGCENVFHCREGKWAGASSPVSFMCLRRSFV